MTSRHGDPVGARLRQFYAALIDERRLGARRSFFARVWRSDFFWLGHDMAKRTIADELIEEIISGPFPTDRDKSTAELKRMAKFFAKRLAEIEAELQRRKR